MYADFTKIGRKGYLVVPRTLLEEALRTEASFTMAQAYLYLFMRCEFCDRKGEGALKRGQVAFTSKELAERFGWKRTTVRDYLHDLERLGVVKLEVVKGVKSIVTLCFYEALTGGRGKPMEEREQVRFMEFWKRYYDLLDREGSDLYAALAEWGRIDQKERRMAMENMELYFRSLSDIRYVKSAGNYLRFKVFLMRDHA